MLMKSTKLLIEIQPFFIFRPLDQFKPVYTLPTPNYKMRISPPNDITPIQTKRNNHNNEQDKQTKRANFTLIDWHLLDGIFRLC